MAMKSGTVRWFNAVKGYGYIRPNDGGFDVFVGILAAERAGLGALKEGQKVNFDIATDPRTGEVFAENLSPVVVEPAEAPPPVRAGLSSAFRLMTGRPPS
jgi:CspA family cold shock protein